MLSGRNTEEVYWPASLTSNWQRPDSSFPRILVGKYSFTAYTFAGNLTMRLGRPNASGTTQKSLFSGRLSAPITVSGIQRKSFLRHSNNASRNPARLAVARQEPSTEPSSLPGNLRYPAAGYPPGQTPPQQQTPPSQQQYPQMQPRQADRPPPEGSSQYQQQSRGWQGGYQAQWQGPGPVEGGGERGWGPQPGMGRAPVDPRAGQLVLRVSLCKFQCTFRPPRVLAIPPLLSPSCS